MGEHFCEKCKTFHPPGACQEIRGSLSKMEERKRKIGLLEKKLTELEEQMKPLEEEKNKEEAEETWEGAQEIFDLLSKQLPKGKRVSVSVEDLPEFEVGGFCPDGYDATVLTVFPTGKNVDQKTEVWRSDLKAFDYAERKEQNPNLPPSRAINFEAVAGHSPDSMNYIRLSIVSDNEGRALEIKSETEHHQLGKVYGVNEEGKRVSEYRFNKLPEKKKKVKKVPSIEEAGSFEEVIHLGKILGSLQLERNKPDDKGGYINQGVFNALFSRIREKLMVGLPVREVYRSHNYSINIAGGDSGWKDTREPIKKKDGTEFVLKE